MIYLLIPNKNFPIRTVKLRDEKWIQSSVTKTFEVTCI
ncbi:hypothetical protein LEP1GSC132_3913 [Leptospira kirschneri str. 200803703]|nr:hypothetical protein LEP1GSC044_1457 [Leptospira kirschneri serovar Grippotyphosa str. RM52]EMK17248.1 hypothetical protein LEP1GSC042_0334 [Leptospira kirschneri serovar Bim str. PUO 1247]EMN25838.1 hypothetical protein LEP1GSC065_3067 [Leptospira kirschneri serovar Sokoine str. RM1]EMO66723.1 hypothetical protein LEP1GSC132_3913 [Leptospira kirschneri str. 200803703]EMO77789.1 hypothetical protein LEP1GSC127_3245 [Leptospira kirschneri str. 200801925]EMO82623.1 hypothetical protein LEP1GS